jgi:hypothetical protein
MQRIVVEHDFPQPVSRVFAHLAEHENLAPVFGARIRRIKDGGDGHRNGVGSAREMRVGPLPAFVETVVDFVPDELIRYRITKGSPLRDHEGTMRFEPRGSRTHLHLEIRFRAVVPGLDRLVASSLRRTIERGLREVEAAA